MKISKENAANAISRAMNCLEYQTQLKLYNALMYYLTTGKKQGAELDCEELGMLTLMTTLIDCANETDEETSGKD